MSARPGRHLRVSGEPCHEPARGPQIDLERVLPAQRTGHVPHRRGVLRLVAYQQRLVPAVPEKRERDIDRARRRAICDDEKPLPAAPARQRRQLADLAERQHARLVPHRGDALDELHRRVVQDRPRDRKSTRLNSSHRTISYAVFCLKTKKKNYYAISEQTKIKKTNNIKN